METPLCFSLTRKSENKKTGPIATSISSNKTCPPSCGMFGACYAKYGPASIHWNKINTGHGRSFSEFLSELESLPKNYLFRHNVSGDLPGISEDIDFDMLKALVSRTQRLTAWTYTHKQPVGKNLHFIRSANALGLTINLSADNYTEADALFKTGLPVTTVQSDTAPKVEHTPGGVRIVRCPAANSEGGITCASCGNGKPLCYRNKREYIIGFPAHGIKKKIALKVIQNK